MTGTSSSVLDSPKTTKVIKSSATPDLKETPSSKMDVSDVLDISDEIPIEILSDSTATSSKSKKINKSTKNSQPPLKVPSEKKSIEKTPKSKKENLVESTITNKLDKSKSASKSNTPTGDVETVKSKGLLRPSKLDAVTDTPSPVVGSFSSFGQHQNERKGKRKWKPSLKMQQHVVALTEQKRNSLGSPNNSSTPKFGQATFGSQLSVPNTGITKEFPAPDIAEKQKKDANNEGNDLSLEQEIDVTEFDLSSDSTIKSKWGSSRLRKIENKFVKTGNRVGASDIENQEPSNVGKTKTLEKSQKPIIRKSKLNDHDSEMIPVNVAKHGNIPNGKSNPLIRESRLKLNNEVLEQLRAPYHEAEYYQTIQRSIHGSDRKSPNLIDSMQNPAGLALVSSNEDGEQVSNHVMKNATHSKQAKASPAKSSNRMPGHIVCGICGAVRYYSFILQAKKFGTFSCEPCRKFISKCIKTSSTTKDGIELFSCVMTDKTSNKTKTISEPGMCVVPPVIRKNPTNPQAAIKTSDQNVDSSGNPLRCQACWLKLCLIGYNLESTLYEKLRLHLSPKKIFQKLLPPSSERGKCASLIPHRGKILELEKPLFDGNNSFNSSIDAAQDIQSDEIPKKRRKFGNLNDTPNCIERLPNGWTKKAMKHVTGKSKDSLASILL